MSRNYLHVFILFVGLFLQFSCIGIAPTHEVREIDSLNNKSYSFRYRDLDSSYVYALEAYQKVNYYDLGKAEACNHLGFYFFMQMDFEEALRWHKKTYVTTKNEIELLIADIGHMKIYQRTGRNKEFYDFRNSALQRMKQIEEDYTVFVEKNERLRLFYAYSEFYFVTTIYHFYLQQQEEAGKALKEYEEGVESNKFWALEHEKYKDESQELCYHYIKGITQLVDGEYADQIKLLSFDELFFTWFIASKNNYPFFIASSLEGLSQLMVRPSDYRFYAEWRNSAFKQLGYDINESLPLRLSQEALELFKSKKDSYQIAGAYVTIGELLNVKGEYEFALDTLSKALDRVNLHHQQYYEKHHLSGHFDSLKSYDSTIIAGTYPEIMWIKENLLTVPEWIARIREQLSFTYAGLGNKRASDFNRNIYLDILNYTRQDREIESRYDGLKKEEKNLNIILFIALIVAIITIVLFVFFYKRSQRRNAEYVNHLQVILELCKKITSIVLTESKSNNELAGFLLKQLITPFNQIIDVVALRIGLKNEMGSLEYYDSSFFSEKESTSLKGCFKTSFNLNESTQERKRIGVLEVYTNLKISKEQYALLSIVIPYLAWSIENSLLFFILGEEYKLLDKERYVYEQRIAKNVRENINKKACLAVVDGIHPYIDRIINEINKLKEPYFFDNLQIRKGKYEYIEELAVRINEYNEILSLWIQIKQGVINLNIESFSLKDVFDLVSKGAKWFELKQQTFIVGQTESWVRGDRALTLFMINTLLDNARKYTPEGGTIRLESVEKDTYIEITVSDTGIGLSQDDVHQIMHEKIYDAQAIGMNELENKEKLKSLKGSGFGLMNCKGIIEKYRKTSNQFSVCEFGVESKKGKGSRFYFRLPRGIERMLIFMGFLFLPFSLLSNSLDFSKYDDLYSHLEPSLLSNKTSLNQEEKVVALSNKSKDLLEEAANYADSVFYANVDLEYEKALTYVQVVLDLLNTHHKKYSSTRFRPLTLYSNKYPAELDWWNVGFETDYHTILDVRNEAAVAFMALKDWDGYQYNNEAFTKLYKMLGVDSTLDKYCKELERSRSGKVMGITLILLFPLLMGVAYYFVYIRKRLIYRWNLEQLLEIHKNFLLASSIPIDEGDMLQREEETIKLIPQQLTTQSFTVINDLFSIDRIGLAVYNETTRKLEYSFNPSKKEWINEIDECYLSERKIIKDGKYVLPLWIDAGEIHQKVGVFYMEKKEGRLQEADEVLLELMTSYLAIVVFNAIVKLANRYRDIESAQEETQRALWEEGVLHVQNMVLDNCLSTLKHETIYYPNKIRQLVNHLQSKDIDEKREVSIISDIDELVIFYKDIFSLLSKWANKQLEEITFRRKVIPVNDLLGYASDYFNKRKSDLSNAESIILYVDELSEEIIGDKNQLEYLFANLIDASLCNTKSGTLWLKAMEKEQFIEFVLIDERQDRTEEELRTLFYPQLNRIKETSSKNIGIEYLLCKQIIREQEEYIGRRGCKIEAIKNKKGGDCIVFTLPKR